MGIVPKSTRWNGATLVCPKKEEDSVVETYIVSILLYLLNKVEEC